MRIPAFLADHPGEALLGAVLLLALIFGSADHHAADVAQAPRDGAKIAISTGM